MKLNRGGARFRLRRTVTCLVMTLSLLAGACLIPGISYTGHAATVTTAAKTQVRVLVKKSIKKKSKVRNATKIPVLTYHRILADAEKKTAEYKNDRYAISVKEFDKQMKWLKKKRYKAITCEELYLWRTGKIKLPKRSVLITIDDGHAESIENAVRVFKKYKLKGTAFIVGKPAYESNGSYTITYSRIQTLRRTNPGQIEFQSHTYNIHRPNAYLTETYQAVMNDAAAQKEMYGFTYLAYPHGKYSAQMISAYKNSGIKMAFLFGKSGYATRKQDLYQMKRIEVTGNMKLRKFKRWCK